MSVRVACSRSSGEHGLSSAMSADFYFKLRDLIRTFMKATLRLDCPGRRTAMFPNVLSRCVVVSIGLLGQVSIGPCALLAKIVETCRRRGAVVRELPGTDIPAGRKGPALSAFCHPLTQSCPKKGLDGYPSRVAGQRQRATRFAENFSAPPLEACGPAVMRESRRLSWHRIGPSTASVARPLGSRALHRPATPGRGDSAGIPGYFLAVSALPS